jgi:hypothetical protein
MALVHRSDFIEQLLAVDPAVVRKALEKSAE